MKQIDVIEQLFGIKITGNAREYTYDKPVMLSLAQAVVNANPNVAWQDPQNPDCGNNDGVLYLALSITDEDGIDCEPMLFAFDNVNMAFYIV